MSHNGPASFRINASPRVSRSSGFFAPILGLFGIASAGCALLSFNICVYLAIAAIHGLWTSRNLDFWVSFYQGHAVHVPFWLAWVASLPGPLTFLANVVAEIAKWFV